MTFVSLFLAALLPAIGLVLWVGRAIMAQAATIHSFSNFEGMHFEDASTS